MPDREKVIKGLQEIVDDKWMMNHADWYVIVCDDALELLKEQQAKPQRYEEHDIFHLPLCPAENCNAVIKKEWHYCPYCKQAIQWDDDLAERVNAEGL